MQYLAKSPSINEDLSIDEDTVVMGEDSKGAMLCSCGQIMTKYRISHESARKLDYCASCQSIWMDEGEWEYLRTNNLHRSINTIFTDSWQRNIVLKRTENVLDENFKGRLGAECYKKLKETREWISKSKNKDLMLSYLNAANPYVVGK